MSIVFEIGLPRLLIFAYQLVALSCSLGVFRLVDTRDPQI